ncbi:hypothetical protein [Metabacillus sediminilitoris]|uniref:hypothetical protein n=1 Tax=Metabacillus sediminilitoris TaxID=2567941 RepID=UPI0012D7F4BD|nr:hypothetical protein [Metabacillus sediminilitoris]QGQ48495.1 hypothetical protein GMB29_26435 [Metabacillus sediminilitoris]
MRMIYYHTLGTYNEVEEDGSIHQTFRICFIIRKHIEQMGEADGKEGDYWDTWLRVQSI